MAQPPPIADEGILLKSPLHSFLQGIVMMRTLVLVTAIAAGTLVLGACASQNSGDPAPKATVAQAAPVPASQQKGQQMVCTSGTPIGTHIARTNCITEQQYQAQQKANAAERAKLQAAQQQQLSRQHPGGGGLR